MSVVQVGESSFENEVIKNKGFTLVDFWAEWCMPCKRLMPIVEVVSEKFPNVKFTKVNVDENPNLASQFNIRTIPTLVLLKNGTPVAVKNGGAPAVELSQWIVENVGSL